MLASSVLDKLTGFMEALSAINRVVLTRLEAHTHILERLAPPAQ